MNHIYRNPRVVLALLFLALHWQGMAQLNIVNGGNTGTSGTGWSISGNVLTVSGNVSIDADVILTHLTNTGSLTVDVPFVSGTEKSITISENIAYTGANARTLTFKAANHITVASGVNITSSNAALNLVLRSAVSGGVTPDYGRVMLNAPVVNTNGGHFWAGGGITDATFNGLTVGSSSARTWSDDVAGLYLVGGSITTVGGSISLAGRSFDTGDDNGVNRGVYIDNCSISSGAGSINIEGTLQGRYTNGYGTDIDASTGHVSISSTTGAISISGTGQDQSTNGNGWRYALAIGQSSSNRTSISSTSGNITLTGTASFNATINDKEGLAVASSIANGLKIVSSSGNISLYGSNTREADGQYSNSIRFTASANVTNAIQIGRDGSNAYSGNILIQGNSIYQRRSQAGSGSIAIKSSGNLTIEPQGSSFTYMRDEDASTLTFDDDWDFGTGLSGFTYGKTGNTQDLSYASPLTVAGPITFHVNSFTINSNITSSTASDVSINANVNFTTSNTRQTIASAGGDIIIHADKDANGTGELNLDYLTLNPGTGNVTIRGETFSWTTTNNTDKPYINGTGSFTLEPSNAAFGEALSTLWFFIDQDANGISGVTLGKAGNSTEITLDHVGSVSGMTVAGPVSVYGGKITLSTPLTSSANGDIFLKSVSGANNNFVNNTTITKSGGTGTLTFQGHARIQNSGTITTSGSGVLNVVMWSDFDNSNNDGGVSPVGAISTNGGHVWIGGSNSSGGSYTWNGLAVGDGPSVATANFNTNPIDLGSAVTTSGGDFLAWADNYIGVGASGAVNAGAGSITLIADNTYNAFPLTTTGTLTLAPDNGAYSSALTVGGTLSSGNLSLNTGHYSGIQINSVANLAGLTIGRYNGMLSGSTPVVQSNSSGVTIASAIGITGPIGLYGGAIALNANLATTGGTTGNMTISGTTVSGSGNLVVANGRTATISVSSASTYAGIVSGTGSGLTKSGAALLTLTNDQTYTGATTISAGDLQVGSGGSVSQASSGSLASASAVSVASGSKLILAPNENVTFANAVSGDGGLEIKGMSGRYYNAFLTGTAATIASNSSVLEVLTRITGGLQWGANVFTGGVSRACAAYMKRYNASSNTATLQFQQWDGQFTKVVFAELTQSGTNVQIRANTSVYATGSAYREANVLGQDMSTGASVINLATTSTASGYGIAEVYMSGKVNFTGTLTYAAATTLSNTVTSVTSPNTYSYTSRGTQEITDASSSFPTGGAVVNNGLVIFNRSTALEYSGVMSGTEDVLQVGAAITMTGGNTHTGTTTVDLNKTLNIGSGGSTGSIASNIVNYGALTFNRSDASSYAGIISGTGTLTKSGAGALTLTGLNTYTGATSINAGSLILERNVPATSSSGFSGVGTLVIQPSSTSFSGPVNYPISGFSVSSTIGGLTVGKSGNTQTINFNGATQAAGPITAYGTVTIGADLATTGSGDINIYSDATLTVSGTRTANAAGLFRYMPNGTSFTNAVSFPIGSLTVTSNGLQLGKSGNTQALTITGSASSNGPVTVFCGDFTTNASSTLTATGSTLEVNASGNVNLNAALAGSTTTVNGQGNVKTIGSLTNLNLSGGNGQSITGTADLTNLTLNKSAGTATVAAGPQNVTGVLTLTAGTLAAGGNITLKSTASGTARVAQHGTGTGTVTGNVVVERHIPGSRKMQWRMLAFPYNAAMALSGVSGIKINYTSPQTMMYFDESLDNGITGNGATRNGGYRSFTSSDQTVAVGQGVMAWIYGDASTSTGPANGTLGATALTMSSQGVLNETGADVPIPVTNGAGGWNLVGNPFASTIDWELVRAATGSSNLSATLYRWDPEAANWTTFNIDGTVTGNGSRYIESGAAFFVKSAGTGAISLTIPQSAKVTEVPTNLHFGRAPWRLDLPQERMDANRKRLAGLRLKASGMGNPIPGEAYVDVSKPDATKGWDPRYDALMMSRSSGANVYLDGERDEDFTVNFDAPLPPGGKRQYPLTVTSPAAGRTTLEIASEGDWNPLNSVSLIDTREGKTILMQGGRLSHLFDMTSLKEEGRFILAINHVAIEKDGGVPGRQIRILGNPVTGEKIDLLLAHPTAKPKRWELSSMQGAKVAEGRFEPTEGNVQYGLQAPGMRAAGVYVLRVELDNGELQTVQVMRK